MSLTTITFLGHGVKSERVVAVNSNEEAIQYFTAAMEMDPNYSEYYNERGNVFLRMGQDEKRRRLLMAIALSPPYYEVLTNLGQRCRCLGWMEKAVQAYSKSAGPLNQARA